MATKPLPSMPYPLAFALDYCTHLAIQCGTLHALLTQDYDLLKEIAWEIADEEDLDLQRDTYVAYKFFSVAADLEKFVSETLDGFDNLPDRLPLQDAVFASHCLAATEMQGTVRFGPIVAPSWHSVAEELADRILSLMKMKRWNRDEVCNYLRRSTNNRDERYSPSGDYMELLAKIEQEACVAWGKLVSLNGNHVFAEAPCELKPYYFMSDLTSMLDVNNHTINKHAEAAGVEKATRGRKKKYSPDEVINILRQMENSAYQQCCREAAKRVLATLTMDSHTVAS